MQKPGVGYAPEAPKGGPGGRSPPGWSIFSTYGIYTYIYIYMCTEKEKEKDTDKEKEKEKE